LHFALSTKKNLKKLSEEQETGAMPSPTPTAEGLAASGLTDLEIAIIEELSLEDALNGAREEARNSGLPVSARGPANAYQHLLISGELWRRLGPIAGPIAAAGHEVGNDARGDQTFLDSTMDGYNNSIVTRERPAFKTWEDVVRWARAKIVESASHKGDGEEGRALWLEKQPADWRPDFENVPITPIEKGGPEHRFGAQVAGADVTGAPELPAAADPLDRLVETWSEQDVRTVLNSPAYLEPQHARREQAQRMVRAWFEQHFGTGPSRVDATGRLVRDGGAVARSGGGLPGVGARSHAPRRQGRGGGALPRHARRLSDPRASPAPIGPS
jgi:hypothetical protein